MHGLVIYSKDPMVYLYILRTLLSSYIFLGLYGLVIYLKRKHAVTLTLLYIYRALQMIFMSIIAFNVDGIFC